MRIIVTHHSPDLDAITSVWLIKRFLPGWEEAEVRFVPAGQKLGRLRKFSSQQLPRNTGLPFAKNVDSENFAGSPHKVSVIEIIDNNEVIHVDTGLGPLDHHQTPSTKVSAASLTFDFVKRTNNKQLTTNKTKTQAVRRMVGVVVDIDHFKESLWPDALADYHELSLTGLIEGLRNQFPGDEKKTVEFMLLCLDATLHNFENRVYAEKEMEKGIKFKFGKDQGIAFETINDTVLPLAQKAGYKIVVRRDPRKGYVRIKVRPDEDIDLTNVYDKLKKQDKEATWFLHISKKMLLNGTTKNPKMKPTKLSLEEIIKVLERV